MSVLQDICDRRRRDVEDDQLRVPLDELRGRSHYNREPLSLAGALRASRGVRVIAEHKRGSPSQGDYGTTASLRSVIEGYVEAGAVALSILTEPSWFGGALQHLESARTLVDVPLLRKDFTVSPYQVHEAKAAGADAILLIAAALTREQAGRLADLARALGLEVLLELHAEEELGYLGIEPDVVGINNRNLKTLAIDLASSERLIGQLPPTLARISESGIQTPADAARVLAAGYDGMLVGTQFMRTQNPGLRLRQFRRETAALLAPKPSAT